MFISERAARQIDSSGNREIDPLLRRGRVIIEHCRSIGDALLDRETARPIELRLVQQNANTKKIIWYQSTKINLAQM